MSTYTSRFSGSQIDAVIASGGSPKGVYTYLSELQAAYPTGSSGIYIIRGNVAEVDTLTVTAVPSAAGNISVTLNGAATVIAVDPAVQTTTALAAELIRETSFSGWTTGGTGSAVTFTRTSAGVCSAPVFTDTGSTGMTAAVAVTTAGAAPDGYWYYWDGTAWAAGAEYTSDTAVANKTDKVIPAAPSNIAVLGADGNLADGGQTVDQLVPKASIVNDVTTGGADVPLSAEQGKTLWDNVNFPVENLITGGDAERSFTATAQYQGDIVTIPNYVNYRRHLLYFASYIKTGSTTIPLLLNDGINQTKVYPTITGQYARLSGIRTISESATALYIRLQDERASGWTANYWQYRIVIDLTACFCNGVIGTGNEPSQAQMDKLLSFYDDYWLDGIANLTKSDRMVPYLLTQIANKINTNDIVNNDTTGGTSVPASAEIVKTHGAEIDNRVRYDAAQTLAVDQQLQARENIDAPIQTYAEHSAWPWNVEYAANGLAKSAVLTGNTVQDGTPTPDAPIGVQCVKSGTQVSVCGKNLFDKSKRTLDRTIDPTKGVQVITSTTDLSAYIRISPNTKYSISGRSSGGNMAFFDLNKEYITGEYISANVVMTAPDKAAFLKFSMLKSDVDTTQLELGSDATAYEAYQSCGTFTLERDMYKWDSFDPLTGLYTVGTGIKVIDGTEEWYQYSDEVPHLYYADVLQQAGKGGQTYESYSTHFLWNSGMLLETDKDYHRLRGEAATYRLYILSAQYTVLSDFKAWLATQYAAGTPVTVVYQLATQTTVQSTPNEITLPDGVCNVITDSAVQPSNLDMVYPLDVYNALLARVVTLESAVAALGTT